MPLPLDTPSHGNLRPAASSRPAPTAFATVLDHVPILVWLADSRLQRTYSNRAWREFTGRDGAEEAGPGWMAGIHPEDISRVRAAHQAHAGVRGEFVVEYRLRRNDGAYRWMQERISVQLEGDALVGYIGACSDTTEQKEVEEELQSQSRRLVSILEGTNVGTWEWNVQTGQTIFNERWAQMIGYTSEELGETTIETWRRFAHPEDLQVSERQLRLHFAGELPFYECECRMRHKDGRWIWVHDRGRLFSRNANGEPLMMAGTHTDITARKEAEQSVRENEARLREAQRVARVGSWLWSPGGALVWSDFMFELFGVSPGEEPTMDLFLTLVHPEDRAQCAEGFERWLRSDVEHNEAEYRIVTKDGAVRHVVALGDVTRDEQGNPLRAVGTVQDITERKRIEQALVQQAARQALLLEATDAIVAASQDRQALSRILYEKVAPILDADVGFNYEVSDGQLRLLEGFGLTEKDARSSQSVRLGQAFCGTVAATGRSLAADAARVASDPLGTFLHRMGVRSYMCHPLLARDGKILGTFSVASRRRDAFSAEEIGFLHTLSHFIALAWERVAAEQSLRASETRFRELAENINEVFWVSTPDGAQMLYVSPAFESIWGRSCASACATPSSWFEAIAADHQARVAAARRTQGNASGYREEYAILRPDGSTRWVRDRAFPIRGDDGRVVRMVGVAEDISVEKAAEEERVRLAAFPELNPNPVLELDRHLRVLYCNEAATRLAHDLGFRNVGEMLPRDAAGLVEECLAKNASRRHIERPYGRRIISWSFYAVAGKGTVHCYAGDVTERRNLEEQFRQAQKMEAIGQLAGGVAHDFNNILAAMMMQLSLARETRGLTLELHELLQELGEGAERAAALTRQLLLFSRREPVRYQTVDLFQLVENLSRMLRRVVGEHIDLTVHCQGGGVHIEADPGMVEQVIVNLCVNARDAMPKGGELTLDVEKVDVRSEDVAHRIDAHPGSFARITITDTGDGIAPAALPHIFEPFFTTKEAGKGTGLGLATAAGIVKQHKGWIEVESTVGRGAAFRVFLPLVESGGADGRTADAPAAPSRREDVILFVEDEYLVRRATAIVLRRSGYVVLEAGTAAEALNVWEQNPRIDLVLTDMILPGGATGIDLGERLRQMRPSLPIILFSGYTADYLQGDPAKKIVYVPKPCEPAKLLKLIADSLLDQKRTEQH